MQTFLPLPGFTRSAKVLDDKRLGKQRVECKQILRSLGVPVGDGTSTGWQHHPAVKMWAGHEYSLACYAIAVCDEWRRRGFNDSLLPQFEDAATQLYESGADINRPAWMGDDALHASHRSNLVRKNADHYSQFGWEEDGSRPYVWPS